MRFRLWLSWFAVLAACTQPVPIVDEISAPPLPRGIYDEAARAGAAVYRIDPQQSLILVRVGRAGPAQRLGHDHAVASEDVAGLVAIYDDRARSHADVVFPIRNLVVDAAEYRVKLELDTDPSADDVAGTYTNMLKVFEPTDYPWVAIKARFAGDDTELSASVTLHGTAHEYLLPAQLDVGPERLVVSGTTTLRHSDFGLEPYAAGGGLLRVADTLEIEFRFVAPRCRSRSVVQSEAESRRVCVAEVPDSIKENGRGIS